VTALAVTWTAVVAGAAPREVLVVGSRVHVGDLVANASESAAAVEVGPAPAPGASRLVTRADIVSALSAKQVIVPPLLPDVVRVVRKVRHLASSEVDAIVRLAMVASPLGKGVTLSAVHVDHAVDVADGWSRVVMDVPRAPKRVGAFHTTAIASFFADSELLGRIVVPLDLSVSTEGAEYDVLRGSPVGVVVRRGAVEVRTTGFAASDADIGDRLPVVLRPSGRVLRTRLVSKDEVLVLEDGQ
jgi:hypothetical protein